MNPAAWWRFPQTKEGRLIRDTPLIRTTLPCACTGSSVGSGTARALFALILGCILLALLYQFGVFRLLAWTWPITIVVAWVLVAVKTGKMPTFWLARALYALESAQWCMLACLGPWFRRWLRQFRLEWRRVLEAR